MVLNEDDLTRPRSRYKLTKSPSVLGAILLPKSFRRAPVPWCKKMVLLTAGVLGAEILSCADDNK